MTELRKLLLIANAFTFTTAETVQVAAAATIKTLNLQVWNQIIEILHIFLTILLLHLNSFNLCMLLLLYDLFIFCMRTCTAKYRFCSRGDTLYYRTCKAGYGYGGLSYGYCNLSKAVSTKYFFRNCGKS